MRRFVRFVCLFLVFASVATIPVFAVENTESRASSYFAYGSAYFTVTSSTELEICFDVTAVGMMDELGASKIVLERSTDGVNWSPVKTYYKGSYSQMVDDDGAFMYSASVPYTYSNGYYYCATVTLYAKQGNNTANSTVSTSILDLT